LRLIVLGAPAILSLPRPAPAEVRASDSAADSAYSDGWQGLKGTVPAETGTDNGGSGFQGWNFDDTFWEAESSPYSTPHFLDTVPSTFNNLGAPAFAVTNGNVAFNGYSTETLRPFAGPLRVGDEFSMDIDNPQLKLLEEGDSAGIIIRLQTADRKERFGLFLAAGFNDDHWSITDLRGSEADSGFSAEAGSSGFRMALKLTGEEDYRLTITPRVGNPVTIENKLGDPGTGPITRLQIVLYGNGSGDGEDAATGERELYFNNLKIEGGGAPTAMQLPTDCNQDGDVDLSDPICVLMQLFLGAPTPPPCEGTLSAPGNVKLLDANGDTRLDLSDPIYVLQYLFVGGDPPALGIQCQSIPGCPDNSAKCP
jgi:hypothetical protein